MTNANNRFEFPGFGILNESETDSHEFVVGSILTRREGGMVVCLQLLRAKTEGFKLPFLIASVRTADQKRELWTFKKEGWQGFGYLSLAGEEPVIALAHRGLVKELGAVSRVISLHDIATGTRSTNVQVMLEMKKSAAEFLGRDYDLSANERRVNDILYSERNAERLAQNKADFEARELARRERIAMLQARPKIVGFTVDGQKRYGTPVVKDEWKVLPNSSFCMSVESYDESAKTYDGLLESFRVVKESGKNPAQANLAKVTLTQPQGAGNYGVNVPKSLGKALIRNKDGFHDVEIYGSDDDIVALQSSGLNGGTYVALKQKGQTDLLLRQVFADKIVKVQGAFRAE